MAKDSATTSKRRKRDSEDQKRDREVYRYLLGHTQLDLSGTPLTPNETSIAKQWGFEDNRIFIRRMLRSVLYREYYEPKDETEQPVPGLTLSKLVGILSTLQKYQRDEQAKQSLPSNLKPSRIITHAEKRKALNLFFQLSPEERDQLELPAHPGQALLDQIPQKADAPTSIHGAKSARQLYDFFLRQSVPSSDQSFADALRNSNLSDAQSLLRQIVNLYTQQHFSGLSGADRIKADTKVFERVNREIKRIELQSGIEQANYFLGPKTSDQANGQANDQANDRLHNYLTADFIHRLVDSVVDNELVADDFPVHIKYFEIERVKPLPLYIKQENENIGVLNKALFPADEEGSISGLERQVAYRIKVHFYIKIPQDYKPRFENLTVITHIAGQRRLEFFEEVIGIGCPTSHITAAIDRVLFWDIPILKEYTPFADGIHCNDETVGVTPNSPVWSHCVARLYKIKDIKEAIEKNKPCNDVATTVEVASANFCGFDLVETTAKAALHARLKLIKQTLTHRPDITASEYMEQLCQKVEELTALKRAKRLLSFYPFSIRAMEGQLEATIFADNYRKRRGAYKFTECAPGTSWTVVALDGHLSIAEANLKEGLTHIAKQCLDIIRPQFESSDSTPGELLKTRYHLCWFRYYYLSDLEDPDCQFDDRYSAIRAADKSLEQAETCLKRRLKKYEKLDELPQANLHPQLYFLSRIYAHRAKLYVFFPNYMSKLDPWATLLKPVELLEKARIYAARDGDSALYAQWSAYQSWCYIMLAYLGTQESVQRPTTSGLDRQDCLELAQRLINHADLCYSETGKICYQQIKDWGGRTTKYFSAPNKSHADDAGNNNHPIGATKYYERYGNTFVQVVPLIQELSDKSKPDFEQDKPASHVVSLDVSLLRRWRTDEGNAIYLFGMQSSILLFAKGMLTLCQDYESDDELIKIIETESLRLFTYCCAIANDGTTRNERKESWPTEVSKDALFLDRVFPEQSEESLLQCLYPHRLTQFADLGKIFIIVCELILIAQNQASQSWATANDNAVKKSQAIIEKRTAKISKLIKELRKNDQFPFSGAEACGQTRYNAHFAKHYAELETYTHKILERLNDLPQGISIIQIKTIIVTDIFNIVRGETGVLPRIF